jgi:patatin-related protein
MVSSAPVPDELRVALAMRGGVSLAVWIGGACAEVDTLRRATQPDATDSFYGRLAGLAGITRVTVDVMAGASAGGLNAAMAAAAIAYGGDLESVRDVWLETADLDELAHPPGEDDIAAPLRGDDHLLRKLREALGTVASGPWQAPQALDVSLAATLLTGEPIPAVQGDDVSIEHRRSALFSFHAGPESWMSSFEHGTDANAAARRHVIDKLAVAGRSTASFPVAFEPATVWAVRPPTFVRAGAGPTAAGRAPGGHRSLWGVFSHPSGPDHPTPAAVIDGGVLDNIPIAQAIQAIGAARADAPTSRVLLFLHPSPRGEDAPSARTPAASVLDVATRTLTAVTSQETILDDIAALRAFNDRVAAHAAARAALLATLAADDDDAVVEAVRRAASAATESRAWHRWRTQAVTGRFTHLLEDPRTVLGGDMFPDPRMLHPLDRLGRPLPGATRADVRQALRAVIAARLDDAEPGRAPGDELARVQRLATALRSAVREIEAHVDAGTPRATLGRAKEVLYLVSLAAETLGSTAQLVWPALAVAGDDRLRTRPRAWARETDDAYVALVTRHDAARLVRLGDALGDALDAEKDPAAAIDTINELRTAMLARLDRLVSDDATRSGGPLSAGDDPDAAPEPVSGGLTGDVAETLSAVLETCATAVADAAADVAPGTSPQCVVAQLLRAPGDTPVGERLADLDVVFTPLTAWGPANDRPIAFHRISALNPTPLGDWFSRLHDGGGIPLDRKLAGNQLANFSGFLRPEYRANDWMWGRMDAAHTLVGVVADPARLAVRVLDASPEAVLAELREAVLSPAADPIDGQALDDLWRRHEPAVRAELVALGAAAQARVRADASTGAATAGPATPDGSPTATGTSPEGGDRSVPDGMAYVRAVAAAGAPAGEVDRDRAGSGLLPTRLSAVTAVLRERRHLELLAGELPVVHARRRGEKAPTPVADIDELRRLAEGHEIVPASGIRLEQFDKIRPAADRMRSLVVRSVRRDERNIVRATLPWLDRGARLAIRYRLRWLAATAFAAAVLALAAIVTSLLPIPNVVPLACWLGVVLITLAAAVATRRTIGGPARLADAFTGLDPPDH